ncbi:hypothetical protein D3C80_1241050 [compost metagenome]
MNSHIALVKLHEWRVLDLQIIIWLEALDYGHLINIADQILTELNQILCQPAQSTTDLNQSTFYGRPPSSVIFYFYIQILNFQPPKIRMINDPSQVFFYLSTLSRQRSTKSYILLYFQQLLWCDHQPWLINRLITPP